MDRKLALSEEILLAVEKPERYTGGEINSVIKDPASVDIRFAFAFPDVYEIGMSYLGIQILYDLFNRRDDTWCERVYSPWPDLDRVLREKKIPLFCLESQEPVKYFDFLGITLQYELCYTNVLQILDLSGIPFRAADRGEADPIVIGGGPCAYNPEPVADFFDIFYIGDGECVYNELFDLYKVCKKEGASRADFLRRAARIPGLYVPSLYRADYRDDGTLDATAPVEEGVPSSVRRQVAVDMDALVYPVSPVIPYLKATQDRMVLEIQRGCIRGCRFCQAGMVYRPLRERSVNCLLETAKEMIRKTGYDEISLSSLSSSDYSALGEFLPELIRLCGPEGVNISLPSLRIDAFSLDVMSKVQDIRKSSLTFAPEAGTQRLRDVINKGLTEEEILRGSAEAFSGGWSKVKFYFMLGLPLETEEDIRGIATLCGKVAEKYYELPKEQRREKLQITASSSFFVPKPFTPFQWASMNTRGQFLEKARTVKEEVRNQRHQKAIRYTYHEADSSVLEGVLARGDRRVAAVIEEAYRQGACFDAWKEYYRDTIWQEAFAACGIDPAFYTERERELSEVLPWDHIDAGVRKDFLAAEWERAKRAETTPTCRQACSGCGAASYGGGVCHADPDPVL